MRDSIRRRSSEWSNSFRTADLARKRLRELRAKRSEDLSRYRDDPVAFFREILRYRTPDGFFVPLEPWSRQREILEAVATCPRVTVRSGHKVSKSNSAAGCALWWVSTRPTGRVLLTSSTDRQVRGILWRELRSMYVNASVPLGGTLNVDPGTGLQFPDGREVIGFTARDPERMAGFSGRDMLIIADEASGIDDEIFEAIEGNRAGGAHLLMFSNPTKTSGYFFDSHNSKREFWRTIHVSSEETPNVVEGREVIPSLATRAWVEEKRAEWGEDSPQFAVRVRGEFPSQAENAVIGLAMVDGATDRWNGWKKAGGAIDQSERLVLGVDVARFGDDETVIQPRRGMVALEPTVLHSMDTVAVAGQVRKVARELSTPFEHHPPRVQVDEIGVGGGVVDVLRSSGDLEVVGINVAERADDRDEYRLLRDQLWFGLGEWLREGGAIPPNPRLEGELVAPTYKFDVQGRHVVESKDDIKKRLGRSPDRADALCLAAYNGEHREVSSFRVIGL